MVPCPWRTAGAVEDMSSTHTISPQQVWKGRLGERQPHVMGFPDTKRCRLQQVRWGGKGGTLP